MIQRFNVAAHSSKELSCYQSEECLAPRAACQHNNNKCPLTPPHLQLPCERFNTTKLRGVLRKAGTRWRAAGQRMNGCCFLTLNCTDRCGCWSSPRVNSSFTMSSVYVFRTKLRCLFYTKKSSFLITVQHSCSHHLSIATICSQQIPWIWPSVCSFCFTLIHSLVFKGAICKI